MTQARVLKTARALHAAYLYPQVAAFNRAKTARSERSRMFWHSVGRFLFKPYPGMAWTDDDINRWTQIRAQ